MYVQQIFLRKCSGELLRPPWKEGYGLRQPEKQIIGGNKLRESLAQLQDSYNEKLPLEGKLLMVRILFASANRIKGFFN